MRSVRWPSKIPSYQLQLQIGRVAHCCWLWKYLGNMKKMSLFPSVFHLQKSRDMIHGAKWPKYLHRAVSAVSAAVQCHQESWDLLRIHILCDIKSFTEETWLLVSVSSLLWLLFCSQSPHIWHEQLQDITRVCTHVQAVPLQVSMIWDVMRTLNWCGWGWTM